MISSLPKIAKKKQNLILHSLCCGEDQTVNPWTSHPNRYWRQDRVKFMELVLKARMNKAQLILINFAHPGTKHEDKFRLINVFEVDPLNGITKEKSKCINKQEYTAWIKKTSKKFNII